ncbi:MAG TPA: COX15/CtaA family protein, partial [Polyangiaceae bacterium]
ISPVPVTRAGISRFARFAWWVVGYTLLVILFGAVVRITGSGAGCGQHWPSCNGQVLELPHTLKTAIEYSHRATSELSGLAVLALLIWGFRTHPAGDGVRSPAVVAAIFIVIEALVGRHLVRHGLVVNDASVSRAIVMPLHLVSTSILMAALGLCAYRATVPRVPGARLPPRIFWLFACTAVCVLFVSATGALTALGDTVYPVQTSGLSARLQEDQGASAHFLQRLRLIHPLLALLGAGLMLRLGSTAHRFAQGGAAHLLGPALTGLVLMQVLAGVLNVLLSAPAHMQLLHLTLANLAWLALVLLFAAARDSGGRGEADQFTQS